MAALEELPIPIDAVDAVGSVPSEVLERAERDDRVVARAPIMFLRALEPGLDVFDEWAAAHADWAG